MKTTLVALVLSVAFQAQAQSADPTALPPAGAKPADTAPAKVAADDPNRKVCRLERELGSNRAKRICHTRAELDAQSEAARASLSDGQRGQ